MLRKSSIRIGDRQKAAQSEGSWAVSYADFLMVLLSFFIVFFSVDKKSSLYHVAASMSTGLGIGAGQGQSAEKGGGGSGPFIGGSEPEAAEVPARLREIASRFKHARMTTTVNSERILIDLPDNLYSAGDYIAPEAILERVLSPIQPYQDEISITVIGHADNIGFAASRKVVRDNLTLSSVRAAYASTYIRQLLPKTQIFIQAADENIRNSRTLSLSIKAKTGVKHE